MSRSRSEVLGIGAVLTLVQEEFPDVSLSKIRFLEAEGLITPERTTSGYRKFRPADVERLRYILAAQRDRFWPLRVIREALDALDRGLPVEGDHAGLGRPHVPQASVDPDVPPVTGLRTDDGPRLTAAELAEAAGARAALVAELADFGLLRPDSAGLFSGESARITAAARRLSDFGIEPRHLRPFRVAAEREVALVDYAAASAARPDPAEVAQAALALRTALVKDELGRRG
ncbi:MAG: MerR family transcriptional regulator [Dermatophilaceae bacterium]